MPKLLIEGECKIVNNNTANTKENQKHTKERDDTMAAITKPGAFVLNGSKVKDFFEKKTTTSADALKRFEKRKPKDGIVTPFKR